MNKATLAAVILLAVLGVVVIFQALSGDEETPVDPNGPAPSTSVTLGADPTVDPEPSETADPTTEPTGAPVNEAAVAVASDVMVAYSTYSYRDAKPTSWIDRVAVLATDSLAHELEETFGADDPYWDREVVPNQRETRTEVISVVPSGLHKNTATQITFTVTYETAVRTKEMGEWGDPSPMSQWVTVVKQDNGWKASLIVPTSDRS